MSKYVATQMINEMLKRDRQRFHNNLELINESPLGVAALSGTSYNIDRNFTSKKLGFKKPTNNSQVVIDNPESVNLVKPPTKIMRITSPISTSNQIFN